MGIEKIASVWPEWKIGELLGAGSYGKVFKATRVDHSVTSYAAIKVITVPQNKAEVDSLRSEGMDDTASKTYFEGIVQDFVNEIKLMESMKGVSNIVSVEDFKVVERENEIGWDIFIRMELLESFNTHIMNKTLSEDEIIKLGVDICSALELCDQRHIIHRDIKPENIFISSFGDFKLGDFGIAKELGKTTGAMSSKGTYNYMAPEVAHGHKYDHTVDIYSLGIVMYRLLNNNRLPFIDPYAVQITYPERKAATDRRLSGAPLPMPVSASPRLAEIVLKACSYNPAQRFRSAGEMKQALLMYKANRENTAPFTQNIDATVALNNKPNDNNNNAYGSYANPQNYSNFGNYSNPANYGSNYNPVKEKKSSPVKKILIALLIIILVAGISFGGLWLISWIYSPHMLEEALSVITKYNLSL
ncbi:MAG: serine/threonine protein kinase [Ruminococcaceae bacterium]|nr:serine/threonine protein kinase [Oscillospiraceae bacterium]